MAGLSTLMIADKPLEAEFRSRIPFLPARVSWINTARAPTVMDASKARRELGWDPSYDSAETMRT